MGSFEDEILARVSDLGQREAQEAAELLRRQEQRRQRELEREAEVVQLRKLGMMSVELLRKYGIPSQRILAFASVGTHKVPYQSLSGSGVRQEDKKDYVDAGVGWVVFQRSGQGEFGYWRHGVGLDDTGRTFDTQSAYEAGRPKQKSSIFVKTYHTPQGTKQTLEDDTIFKDGVASLISGRGPYIREE